MRMPSHATGISTVGMTQACMRSIWESSLCVCCKPETPLGLCCLETPPPNSMCGQLQLMKTSSDKERTHTQREHNTPSATTSWRHVLPNSSSLLGHRKFMLESLPSALEPRIGLIGSATLHFSITGPIGSAIPTLSQPIQVWPDITLI